MTETAKQSVVNAAMAHLGEPTFADITADPPDAALAKVLAQLEGPAGVEAWALSRHPWLVALTYVTLPPISPKPTNWKWANAFLLPVTFVKLWELDGFAFETPYEIGTETVSGQVRAVLRCDLSSVSIAYTEKKGYDAYAKNPDLMNAMALELAARSAGPLKSDYEAAARLKKLANEAMLEAMSGEAGQHQPLETLHGGLSSLRMSVA
jgi:hypothetical protein